MFVVVVMDDILRKVKSDGYGQNKQKSQSRPAQKLLKQPKYSRFDRSSILGSRPLADGENMSLNP